MYCQLKIQRQSRTWLPVVISLVVTLLMSCGERTISERPATFLRVTGHDIVNEDGEKVFLRGVGLGNWLLPEGYMWHFGEKGDRPRKIEKLILEMTDVEYSARFWQRFRRNFIREADIRKIRELGFNSVRPALNARVFMTEDDSARIIMENFQYLDSLVTWCKKYGVYIILDMHGAPGGQTGQNIDDSPNDLPELFMDKKFEERLIKLWLEIVRRYKDEPIIAGYDLLNEPLPERTGAAEKYGHLVEPLYKKLTTRIRQIDSRHVIFLEGINWSNDWSIFSETFDDNLVYQFHYYCWNRPDELNSINQYIKYREKLNAPIWVGETGEKNLPVYWATTQLFEKNNIGWSFWPWKKLDRTNGLCSINRPKDWELIANYSKGGPKPSKNEAIRVLDEFLGNILFENCRFTTEVYNSLFRQIPGRVAAVNYGHDGYMNSYFVNDTLFRSEYYRKQEPVKIESVENISDWNSIQNIVLNEGEWTAYQIRSCKPDYYKCIIKINSDSEKSKITLIINDFEKVQEITGVGWQEIQMNDIKFREGKNRFQVQALTGTVRIEYFNFSKTQEN